jgi:hypothetical protein
LNDAAFEPEYPAVHSHAGANPITKVLDRRRLPGRLPAGVELIDIPCEYHVLRRNGELEWLPPSSTGLSEEAAHQAVVDFELRYPRDASRPCNSLEDYAATNGYQSPDELPLALDDE